MATRGGQVLRLATADTNKKIDDYRQVKGLLYVNRTVCMVLYTLHN